VVMLASPESHKIPQMSRAWAEWGFRPAAVVIEHRAEPAVRNRVARRLREDGFLGPLRTSFVKRSRAALSISTGNEWATDVAEFCTTQGIPFIHVGRLSEIAAVEAVRRLDPDIFVHAGAGILRRDLLAIPRLGTLNAHMGILPRYRGMNVAEWASLEGSRVGCTVHLINEGIDTGDILAVGELDTEGAATISDLRAIVDDAQISLLGDVLRFIVVTGMLPARRPQAALEGHQYFEMHQELRAVLEARLSTTRQSAGDGWDTDIPLLTLQT
jgi:methionyl-tRNA formyltransferase